MITSPQRQLTNNHISRNDSFAFTTVENGRVFAQLLANFIFRLTNSNPIPRHCHHPLLQPEPRTLFVSVQTSQFLPQCLPQPFRSRHQATSPPIKLHVNMPRFSNVEQSTRNQVNLLLVMTVKRNIS